MELGSPEDKWKQLKSWLGSVKLLELKFHENTTRLNDDLLEIYDYVASLDPTALTLAHRFARNYLSVERFLGEVVKRQFPNGEKAVLKTKKNGDQDGALMELNGEVYFIKTHAGGRRRGTPGVSAKVNPLELLLYKTLELMKLGPAVHFMYCPIMQETFISAKGLKDFVSIERAGEKEALTHADQLAAVDIVVRALGLTDLNAGNFGIHASSGQHPLFAPWGVVDFRITNVSKNLWDDTQYLDTDIHQILSKVHDLGETRGKLASKILELLRDALNGAVVFCAEIKHPENMNDAWKIAMQERVNEALAALEKAIYK